MGRVGPRGAALEPLRGRRPDAPVFSFAAFGHPGREEGAAALFKGIGVRLLWNGVWVGSFLYVQRVAYLDAQRLSLELVGAADAWAVGVGLSLQELVRLYTT